tara:strand:- start:300 stop:500 length:201 start_codon:yes stop_codon:yes gene_type:complete
VQVEVAEEHVMLVEMVDLVVAVDTVEQVDLAILLQQIQLKELLDQLLHQVQDQRQVMLVELEVEQQ